MIRLIFVYKSHRGLFNLLADMAHKIFSPATYPCRLCAITHGNFRMHQEWRQFVKRLDVPVEFLHADELVEKYGQPNDQLPAIFEAGPDGKPRIWMSAQEINAVSSLEELQAVITSRLAAC